MMDLLFWLVGHLRLRKGGGGREGGRFDISVIVGCIVWGEGRGCVGMSYGYNTAHAH